MPPDLYTEFLDIPPGPRPLNHYAILRLPLFEADRVRIHDAVLSQNAKLRRWALHPDRETRNRVQDMLNELGMADFILGDPKTKARYDEELAAELGVALIEGAEPFAPEDKGGSAGLMREPEESVEVAAPEPPARSGSGTEVSEPVPKALPRSATYGVVAGAVAIAAGIIWMLLWPSPPPVAPPRKGGPPKEQAARPVPKAPTVAEKSESDARAAFAKIEAKVKSYRPEFTVNFCDEFLAKYGDTSVAGDAKKLRDAALREMEARLKLAGVERELMDFSRPYAGRRAAAEAFLREFAGTKAAEEFQRRRDDYVARVEGQAAQSFESAKPEIERLLTAKQFGRAADRLTDFLATYARTRAGASAATQLAELQGKLRASFEEKRKLAEDCVRRYAFAAAVPLFDEPLKVWRAPEFQKEAESAIAAIGARRTDIVRKYGDFLEGVAPLLAEAKFEDVLAEAQAAGAKAQDPALKSLFDGKAAEAHMLLSALDRVVAGAKAQIAKAAADKAAGTGDGRVKIQLARSAGGLPAFIANPSRKGLKVEMTGLTGEQPWGKFAREQLLAFARSAPGEPAAADHAALGLLALTGSDLKSAYAEFAAARDAGAQDTVLEILRRNASGLVYVPGGDFLATMTRVTRSLDGFLIDRYEVSQIEYAYFLHAVPGRQPPVGWKGGQPPRGEEDHPVVDVTWDDACAYAEWLGMRLPTALEWERAARGTDGREFPWGDKFDRSGANVAIPVNWKAPAPRPRLLPVNRGSVKGFPFPLVHIVGNAREWTSTPPSEPAPGQRPREYFTVGGSAEDTREEAVRAFVFINIDRRWLVFAAPERRSPFTGFRLAWPR